MWCRFFAIGLPLLGALAGLSGCAGASSGDESLGSAGQPILGGVVDPGDLAVVDILWIQGNIVSECSGSLLAPNLVLTAHHCVSSVQNEVNGAIDCSMSSFSPPDVPADFHVSTKQFFSVNLADYHPVREVVVPPTSSTGTSFCGADQAILILSDDIQPSEAVPLVPRVDGELAAKEEYTAIGFGETGQGSSGTRSRLGALFVDCVGGGCAAAAMSGRQISLQHEWIGDHGACSGDSGGPALDGQGRVVGVTSRGEANCGSPIYGDVFSWAAWIKQTAQHAAELGAYTAAPWVAGYPTDPVYGDPVGGACGTPACPSNLCLADDAGSYCTRLCEAAAPCPSGYTCETVQSLQICQRVQPLAPDGPRPRPHSGCSVLGSDAKPAPWFSGACVAAMALLRRRSRRMRCASRRAP
jgi:hypothetical protein